MSVISPIEFGAPSSTPPGAQEAGGSNLGKNEFLRLLVAQISYQDPLNPMQGHEFAAQLAQFSSVEQLVNIGDVLAKNGELNGLLAQSVNSGVASGLIGKSVETKSNQINWPGEGITEMNFKLESSAKSVTVTIRDKAGNVVRKFDLDGRSDGEHKLEWDGTDASGARLTEGVYTYSVDALDAADKAVAATTIFRGQVDRITFGADGIRLWIGKVSVAMSDVESVRQ